MAETSIIWRHPQSPAAVSCSSVALPSADKVTSLGIAWTLVDQCLFRASFFWGGQNLQSPQMAKSFFGLDNEFQNNVSLKLSFSGQLPLEIIPH